MTGPVLAASNFSKQATVQDNVALTYTTTTTPVAGDIIVVKLGTWGATDTMSAPTGGGQTFTSRVIAAPGGFNQWCAVYTCKVTGSPGNFTITSTPSSVSRHSMEVEHWTSADLAVSPAVNGTVSGIGLAQASLTTTVDGSVISWTSGDVSSKDPATRVALSGGTFEGVRDDHVGSNGVDYHGYQTTTTHGTITFGMSLPGSQTFVIAGVEILPGSSTTPFTKDVVERYRVLNAVTKDVVERYRVTNAFTKDVVETYRVTNAFSKDVVERYRVLNTFTKDTVETYRVLNGFSKDVVERYRVFGPWTKDVVETYRVLNGFSKDVIERYRVLNGWTKDTVETYRILNAWTKDTVERYDILSGTAFTKDVVERYRILNILTKDVLERYRITNAFSKDVVERYSILTTTPFVKDVVERYSILGVVHAADAIADLRPIQVTVAVSPIVATAIADLSPIQATAHLD